MNIFHRYNPNTFKNDLKDKTPEEYEMGYSAVFGGIGIKPKQFVSQAAEVFWKFFPDLQK